KSIEASVTGRLEISPYVYDMTATGTYPGTICSDDKMFCFDLQLKLNPLQDPTQSSPFTVTLHYDGKEGRVYETTHLI
ncbi:hypothetical protein BX616_008056, partial [Lobosporangium transversale]